MKTKLRGRISQRIRNLINQITIGVAYKIFINWVWANVSALDEYSALVFYADFMMRNCYIKANFQLGKNLYSVLYSIWLSRRAWQIRSTAAEHSFEFWMLNFEFIDFESLISRLFLNTQMVIWCCRNKDKRFRYPYKLFS